MSFSSLGLSPTLQKIVNDLGYENPTPIQKSAIPVVLGGKDVMAGAQTGTGKTAAFALPLIHKLLEQKKGLSEQIKRQPRVLVLTPTRELAQQVYQSFIKYTAELSVRTVVAYGGVSINIQISEIEKGVDILVATPGRLLELLMKELIDLTELQSFVLDEADRMLDMGFIIDVERIIKKLPVQKQTLLFSATFDDGIFKLSKNLLKDPQLIEVSERNTAAEQVEQIVYTVDKNKKSSLISFLIGSKNWQQVLIFTRTKQGADALAAEMQKDGIDTQVIHGDKSQGARERALDAFRAGDVRALVATDVAARGIDIIELQYVINHELPYNAEDYIHRIGRTGRAGQAGKAISLVSTAESYLLEEIEKLLSISLVAQWFPGFEPNLEQDLARSNKRSMSNKEKRKRALGVSTKKSKTHKRR